MLIDNAYNATLTAPDGTKVRMTYDDGEGNGNFLIQDLLEYDDGRLLLFLSVTDEASLANGSWRIDEELAGLTIKAGGVSASSVSSLPSLETVDFTYSSANAMQLNAGWTTDGASHIAGKMRFYLTDDAQIVEKINAKTYENAAHGSDAEELSLGTPIGTVPLTGIAGGNAVLDIPEYMPNGEYDLVGALEQDGAGISAAITTTRFTLINPNLPGAVRGATLGYGGGNTLSVDVDVTGIAEDSCNSLYITLYDETNALIGAGYYARADGFEDISISNNLAEDDAVLMAGTKYHAVVTTAKDCGDGIYAHGGIYLSGHPGAGAHVGIA